MNSITWATCPCQATDPGGPALQWDHCGSCKEGSNCHRGHARTVTYVVPCLRVSQAFVVMSYHWNSLDKCDTANPELEWWNPKWLSIAGMDSRHVPSGHVCWLWLSSATLRSWERPGIFCSVSLFCTIMCHTKPCQMDWIEPTRWLCKMLQVCHWKSTRHQRLISCGISWTMAPSLVWFSRGLEIWWRWSGGISFG